MGQRIDVAKLCRRALRYMPDTIDGRPPRTVPDACPMTLEELLREE